METSTINFADMVRKLKKTGADIRPQLTDQDVALWDNSSCIMGEAGELFDALKKHLFYRAEIDRTNVIEELGDLEFYLEAFRVQFGVTREEVITANIKKLATRYVGLTYSDKAAQERADKK